MAFLLIPTVALLLWNRKHQATCLQKGLLLH